MKKNLSTRLNIQTTLTYTYMHTVYQGKAEYRKARRYCIVLCLADQQPEQTTSLVLTCPSLKGVRILNVSNNKTKFDTCLAHLN